ncbi:MAG: inorganic pyrophosphatase [Bacteroidetes bacterium]|nr:inorganic pyrophosphatase [Bacteroidota bacterium]
MKSQFKAHPWHGVSIGKNTPEIVTAFIEIVPTDTMKYEIDKESGYLKIDRPQKFSNIIPALYGFIPQTYCGKTVAEFAASKSKKSNLAGDGDPLDICVLTDRHIPHGDLLLNAVPIGGFRMLDKGEADDKIIAVLKEDEVYRNWTDVNEVPKALINRLHHYFLTYKNMPGEEVHSTEITHVYNKEEAQEVIRRSMYDYKHEIT